MAALISVFADSYSNEGGEEKILDELLHFSDERVNDIVIYPECGFVFVLLYRC